MVFRISSVGGAFGIRKQYLDEIEKVRNIKKVCQRSNRIVLNYVIIRIIFFVDQILFKTKRNYAILSVLSQNLKLHSFNLLVLLRKFYASFISFVVGGP